MRRFDILSEEERIERYANLAKKALLAYGLSANLTYVGRGTHIVFRARLGEGVFAVRIGEPGRDTISVRREVVWLAALGRDTTLAVPEPILTLRGDLFCTVSMEGVPGIRSCAVLRWVGGERREAELTPEEVATMGTLAASLHLHAEGFRWPEEIAPAHRDAAGRTLVACDTLRSVMATPDDRSLLVDAAAFIADGMTSPEIGTKTVGPIHGDLRLRKLRIDAGAAGALGFERCRAGSPLEDLSILWTELGGRRSTPELQQALLDGYRSVRPLSREPRNALRAFTALGILEAVADASAALPHDRHRRGEMAEGTAAGLRRQLAPLLRISDS